jgi:hypothetical protein
LILTRRNFLRSILPAAAAIAVAPTLLEELLELPTKTFFLPPGPGWVTTSFGNVWSKNTLGGYMYSRELAKVLREQVQPLVRFRQFAETHPPTNRLDKLVWDVFADRT